MSTEETRDPMAFPDGERVAVDERGDTTPLPPALTPYHATQQYLALVRESLNAHQRALACANRTIRRETHAIRTSPGLFVQCVREPSGDRIQVGSLLRATLWTAADARELAPHFEDAMGHRGEALAYRATLVEEVARLEKQVAWAEETLALITARAR